MTPKMAHFLFFLLSFICIASVIAMILNKNPAYSALFLIVTLASTAGLFGLMQAPFIAVVQVIIYAGAIMVLFIFVIMMIDIKEGLTPEKKRWIRIPAAVVGIVLAIELFLAFKSAFFPGAPLVRENIGNPTAMGEILFTKYLYPFEITSILIIGAMVGAIVLVKKTDKK
jgi:NADH-quinone oxidoreductase subunit J